MARFKGVMLTLIIVSSALWVTSAFALDCPQGTIKLSDDCKGLADDKDMIGCCSGNLTVWCQYDKDTGEKALCAVDCSQSEHPLLSKCGWDPHAGYYGCFDGGADPSGQYPLNCPSCEPNCDGKECGYDGCYGLCGTCPEGEYCDSTGHCKQCSCGDRECGADECGNPCGTCPEGKGCDETGHCKDLNTQPSVCDNHDNTDDVCAQGDTQCEQIKQCVCKEEADCCKSGKKWNDYCVYLAKECGAKCYCKPDCKGWECGDDGCGGSCGKCADGQYCDVAKDYSSSQCKQCSCDGKECGYDECGNACGACPDGKFCDLTQHKCIDNNPPYCKEKDSSGCGENPNDCDKDVLKCVCQDGISSIFYSQPADPYCCDEKGKWDIVCVIEYQYCGIFLASQSEDQNAHFQVCPCVPKCDNKECGDDGCGGSCGKCNDGFKCNKDGKCVTESCGNGTCDEGENCQNCPDDCGCGDGKVCTAEGKCVDCTKEGETFTVGMGGCCDGLKGISTAKPDENDKCPDHPPVGATLCTNCGDGTCEADKGENKCNCPEDCAENNDKCGNGTCDEGENCNTCPKDCGCEDGKVCTAEGKCVDCTKEGETFVPGKGDCCDGLKAVSTAKPDEDDKCPDHPPVGASLCVNCGNGKCEADKGENKCNCPDDCKEEQEPTCGDGNCDTDNGENCKTCPSDCGCDSGQTCYNGQCCTPNCENKQCGDDGCGGSCGTCPMGEQCEDGQCKSSQSEQDAFTGSDNGQPQVDNGVQPQTDNGQNSNDNGSVSSDNGGQNQGNGGGNGGSSSSGGCTASNTPMGPFGFMILVLTAIAGLFVFRKRLI